MKKIDPKSKTLQAIQWANAEPGRSDYDAAKLFGLSNQGGISAYRKRHGIENPWLVKCPMCGNTLRG